MRTLLDEMLCLANACMSPTFGGISDPYTRTVVTEAANAYSLMLDLADEADDLVDRYHSLQSLYPGVNPSYLEDLEEGYEEETDHPLTYREPDIW